MHQEITLGLFEYRILANTAARVKRGEGRERSDTDVLNRTPSDSAINI